MMRQTRGKREVVEQALADQLSMMKMGTKTLMRDEQAHFQARGYVIELIH
jgi:hypothetical protein